jgi:hypothetical protein
MDQDTKARIQHELDETANRLFPGAIRQVVLLQHGDDPLVEPGELMLRLVVIHPSRDDEERADVYKQAEALRQPGVAKLPAMRQFRDEVSERLPEVRRFELTFEDPSGQPLKPHKTMTFDNQDRPADSDLTPVMARLRPADLEVVDTLISAGIAANRAEAVRWALARISERPAYTQLRQHTRDIERLKTEF